MGTSSGQVSENSISAHSIQLSEGRTRRDSERPWAPSLPPPPEPTSPFPSSILPTRHPECGERLPGPQGHRPAPRFPDAACPMLPPVGGEGRGGSGVTGQPPVHVTWVAAPWCRRVTPPSEPGSDPDPSPGRAPKGCCPGPPAFCPKAQKLGKDSGPRARRPHSEQGAGKQRLHQEPGCRGSMPAFSGPPSSRLPGVQGGALPTGLSPSLLPRPCSSTSSPGSTGPPTGQGPADPMAPSATPDSRPPCQPTP